MHAQEHCSIESAYITFCAFDYLRRLHRSCQHCLWTAYLSDVVKVASTMHAVTFLSCIKMTDKCVDQITAKSEGDCHSTEATVTRHMLKHAPPQPGCCLFWRAMYPLSPVSEAMFGCWVCREEEGEEEGGGELSGVRAGLTCVMDLHLDHKAVCIFILGWAG